MPCLTCLHITSKQSYIRKLVKSFMSLPMPLLLKKAPSRIQSCAPDKQGYFRDNFPIFCKNICYDPTFELSHRDSSNDVSHHMFLLRKRKKYLLIILQIPPYLGPVVQNYRHCWLMFRKTLTSKIRQHFLLKKCEKLLFLSFF